MYPFFSKGIISQNIRIYIIKKTDKPIGVTSILGIKRQADDRQVNERSGHGSAIATLALAPAVF
jgi:hypothetical protein